ncbi:hypothetical protein Tco_0560013, partial [Tanacetum coccineum]
TTMVPEQVKTKKIQAGVQVSRLEDKDVIFSIGSALDIVANLVMHEKAKHFDIDVHLVREKVASGLIRAVKVDTKSHVVDILTKALRTCQHTFECYKWDFEMMELYKLKHGDPGFIIHSPLKSLAVFSLVSFSFSSGFDILIILIRF